MGFRRFSCRSFIKSQCVFGMVLLTTGEGCSVKYTFVKACVNFSARGGRRRKVCFMLKFVVHPASREHRSLVVRGAWSGVLCLTHIDNSIISRKHQVTQSPTDILFLWG